MAKKYSDEEARDILRRLYEFRDSMGAKKHTVPVKRKRAVPQEALDVLKELDEALAEKEGE